MKQFADIGNLPIHYKVNNNQYSNMARFLTDARVKLDWSIYRYNLIPGEGNRLHTERVSKKAQREMEEEEEEEGYDEYNDYEQQHENREEDKGEEAKVDKDALIDKYEAETKINLLRAREKAEKRKDKEDFENNLPEVILLGRCNAGKSSLINALLSKNKNASEEYARVKQTAGYTPCLNFYNIGGLLRLVDSPGYGVKGDQWQGELIFQYLSNRRVFRNAFLIIDSNVGLNQYDEMIINNLSELGVQFDIIFNKIDKIQPERRSEWIKSLIEHPCLDDLPIKPRYFCVASDPKSKHSGITDRSGVTEVLYAIFESCGFDPSGPLRPRLKAKKHPNLIEERQKHQNKMKFKRNTEKKKLQKARK